MSFLHLQIVAQPDAGIEYISHYVHVPDERQQLELLRSLTYQNGEQRVQLLLALALGVSRQRVVAGVRGVLRQVHGRVHDVDELAQLLPEAPYARRPGAVEPIVEHLAHQPPEAARAGVRVRLAAALDIRQLGQPLLDKAAALRIVGLYARVGPGEGRSLRPAEQPALVSPVVQAV